MTSDRDLVTALRSLDAADTPADPRSPRAQADLQRIMATPVGTPRPIRASRRTALPRTALAGGLLAAAAAGVVALPAITGGDAAFASWAPRPDALSPEASAEAASQCRSAQEDGAGTEYREALDHADTAISERRGVWTTVVLAGRGGFSALCVTDTSRHLFADMFGSIGASTDDTDPGPRELIATDLGTGTLDAGDLSVAAGTAGRDITGVTYRSGTHGAVDATVAAGHFALWLPGDELEDAASRGVDVQVTYRDGTTATATLHL